MSKQQRVYNAMTFDPLQKTLRRDLKAPNSNIIGHSNNSNFMVISLNLLSKSWIPR